MGKTNVKSGWKRLLVAVTVAMLLAATLSIALPASAADAGSWDLGAGWTANDDGTFSFTGSGESYLRYVPTEEEQAWQKYAFSMDVTLDADDDVGYDSCGPLVAWTKVEGKTLAASVVIEHGRTITFNRNKYIGEGHYDNILSMGSAVQPLPGNSYTVAVSVDKAAGQAVVVMRAKDDFNTMEVQTVDVDDIMIAADTTVDAAVNTVIGFTAWTGTGMKISNVDMRTLDNMTLNGFQGGTGWNRYVGPNQWVFTPDAFGMMGYENLSAEQDASSYYEFTAKVNVTGLPWCDPSSGAGFGRGFGIGVGRTGDRGFEVGFLMHPEAMNMAPSVLNGHFMKDVKVLDEAVRLTTGEHTFKLTRDMKTQKVVMYYDGKAIVEGTVVIPDGLPIDNTAFGGFASNYSGAHIVLEMDMAFYNNLTVEAGAGGSVDTESGLVALGESKTITVTPDAGYLVDTVTVNGEAATLTDGALVLENILADTAVAVTFKEDVPESSEPESSEEESSEPESSEEESSEPESSEAESSEPESSEAESSEAEASKDEASKDEASKDESSAADEEENPDTGVASALPMLAVALLSGGVALTLKRKNG